MNRLTAIAGMALLLTASAYPAYAQDGNPLDNPTGSSFPASNSPNGPPNEADHTFGKSSDTHRLPADVPPPPGTASDSGGGADSGGSGGRQ